MRSCKWIFIVLVSIGVWACNERKELDAVNYMKWIEESKNGLKARKDVGEFEFTLQYKPLDYVVLLEEGTADVDRIKMTNRIEQLKGMEYYTFSILSNKDNEVMKVNISSEQEYFGRLQYFVSETQNDLLLIRGNDTLPCLLYHFERNYGISPYNRMVLGFEADGDSTESGDRTLIYDDKVLGTGPVHLNISSAAIMHMPQLILNTTN